MKQYKVSKEKYLNYSQLKIESKRDIESNSIKKCELETELEHTRKKLSALLGNQEKDQQVLSEYLKIAEEEFQKQIHQYKERLLKCSREEKAAIIIFIALLERDYNNLIHER